ncbi:ABC transporter ATP-binding protein [Vagococcus carniphilus]|uniref:ABC transporter ATP-binding protein n=1 Tax=Vagococcus carniphilus TaxID=218144 RepID=UPI00288E07F1|nr:ABC transporter ATP-binding protein [Vagococcus carniphilus]MDT2830672.1 ABC transporter ATP-binding protein [Vagococcus carniphilus]MDT2839556.1 ABC transporter ATP-binding protein [Vagococcus carniphilus]MDT2853835.1 ABC transporter ATP-binding protein [Vagococcus carniphilus]
MKLEVQSVNKTYKDKEALSNVSIIFKEQTIYGLLGRNGAGKSTLLNIINNRSFPSSGDILLDNTRVTDNEELLNHVYLMSEDNLFPSSMKVKEMFKISEEFYGSFDWDLANRLTDLFELNQKTTFKKLSTGYRSIAKLITALCVPCDYIFLDEPVLGLDAGHRELFYESLIETFENRPRTFIISTHLIEEITNLLESVIILDQGEVTLQKDVETILQENYTLSGPRDIISDFTKELNIIGKEELGDFVSVHVSGISPETLPTGVRLTPLSLQNYFVQLTKRK